MLVVALFVCVDSHMQCTAHDIVLYARKRILESNQVQSISYEQICTLLLLLNDRLRCKYMTSDGIVKDHQSLRSYATFKNEHL